MVARVHGDGVASPMHHGLVRMELTNGDSTVQVIATHLNPFSSLMRLQEAQVVVSRTRPGEHTLVMGDLNTLPQATTPPSRRGGCWTRSCAPTPTSASTSRGPASRTCWPPTT